LVEFASAAAIEVRTGQAAASLGAQGILCLDDAMIENAKALGMTVVTV
jgi:hypothetical protein